MCVPGVVCSVPSSSHVAASIGSRQEEQARTLGYGCPTTGLQGPHSFISLAGGDYLEMTRVDSIWRVGQM